jgi:hypothetical protein
MSLIDVSVLSQQMERFSTIAHEVEDDLQQGQVRKAKYTPFDFVLEELAIKDVSYSAGLWTGLKEIVLVSGLHIVRDGTITIGTGSSVVLSATAGGTQGSEISRQVRLDLPNLARVVRERVYSVA